MKVTFKVYRFNPQTDNEPHYDTFTVEADPNERILDCLKSYCAEVTTADGETEDYELWGSGDWDGQQGFPVLVKKWDDAIGAGVGERFVIDAEHILIH